MNQSLQKIDCHHWQNIKLIATDMDGTLTQGENFDDKLLEILKELSNRRISVLITTGRSAGWVQAIATYLPVVGAMAENGGLIFWQGNVTPQLLGGIDTITHRQELGKVFDLLQSKFPRLEESQDNIFRLTDWTFDVEGLSTPELEQIDRLCQSVGFGFTYSSIQCHIKPTYQDKAYGLQQIIPQYFAELKPEEIVTVGDSPNDESMFERSKFPLSVGVANVIEYCDRLKHLPAYITNKSAGEGFVELAEMIIDAAI